MSGRRRRDDGWDEGRRDWDAPDSRPDPWSEGGADGRYPTPSFQPATEQATSYDLGGGQAGNGNGYNSSGYDASGYGGRAGYGGQNGAANGYQSAPPEQGYGAGQGDSGYGQRGSGYGNDSGYGNRTGFADAGGATAFVPEFMSAGADYPAPEAAPGMSRPIGRLSIYTLLSDRIAEFDRLAERAAEGVRTTEPDTLVYVIHVVPKAPMQRIVYEIYRNRAAFESHERQPHIRRFVADRASCVLATNVIDLRLKYAKVAALGAPPRAALGAAQAAPAAEQSPWPDGQSASRSVGTAADGDRSRSEQYSNGQYGSSGQYGNGGQYNGDAQHNGAQYGGEATVSRTQYQAPAAASSAAPAASFTPAQDRYTAAATQYAAAAGQYTATGQYGYAGGQAANGGQYPSAAEYPATSGYSDAAGHPGSGYNPTPSYQPNGGYAAGAGYASGSGYSGATGQQAGDGYSNGNGYAGSNGYSGQGAGASFTPAGPAGGQWQAPGGQSYGAAPVTAVRRRELGSGAPSNGGNGYEADEAMGGG